MQPGRSHCRQQHFAASLVAMALLVFVLVIVEGGHHRTLHRRGHHHPGVLANREQFGDHAAVTCDETRAIAGQRRSLRQRVHGQQSGVVAIAYRRVQQRNGFGIPAKAEVALVGCDDRAAFARPARQPCADGRRRARRRSDCSAS